MPGFAGQLREPSPPQLKSIADRVVVSTMKQVDDTNVLEFLAAVGDTSGYDSHAARTEIMKPGASRQDHLDVAKAGLSAAAEGLRLRVGVWARTSWSGSTTFIGPVPRG
jgi:hypothetical protein